MSFREINPKELECKPFSLIADNWMLVTAGSNDEYNTMTASWGYIGEMWGQRSAIAVIRPQRYTFEFIENSDYYTLSFFSEKYKKELSYCGSHSGRDVDKVKECGFTPVITSKGIYFEEADMVLFCRKVYSSDLRPENFKDKAIIDKWYPQNDFHRAYFGIVEKVLVK